jgi:hypothetical protein
VHQGARKREIVLLFQPYAMGSIVPKLSGKKNTVRFHHMVFQMHVNSRLPSICVDTNTHKTRTCCCCCCCCWGKLGGGCRASQPGLFSLFASIMEAALPVRGSRASMGAAQKNSAFTRLDSDSGSKVHRDRQTQSQTQKPESTTHFLGTFP